jgi:single-strand DNA-binding protein
MGNLAADPELQTTKSGQMWCKFRVATNYTHRTDKGDKQQLTTWHNVKVFGKTAEHCHTYLKKGRTALVEGRIQTTPFKKDDGSDGYWTEIVARNVEFVGGRRMPDLTTTQSANEIPF